MKKYEGKTLLLTDKGRNAICELPETFEYLERIFGRDSIVIKPNNNGRYESERADGDLFFALSSCSKESMIDKMNDWWQKNQSSKDRQTQLGPVIEIGNLNAAFGYRMEEREFDSIMDRAIKEGLLVEPFSINANPTSEGEATQCATALVDRLNSCLGGDWKPRVWENLGWHYSASCGSMSVSQSTQGSFSVLMSDKMNDTTGGYPPFCDGRATEISTPEAAVIDAIDTASKLVNRLKNAVNHNIYKLNGSNLKQI
jgi:hypothetical protein